MMDWEEVEWNEVLTIRNGKNQKAVADPNGKYPIYGSGGVMGYANDFLCDEGTTIIGRKGSINKPIFVNKKFWNVDTAFGLCPLERMDNKFFYYFCTTYNFLKHNKATTLPSLTKADLLKIKIPLPPLATQRKIAAILDEADKVRRLNKQLIEKYDALTQSLFLDMFGDPVTNPKGWEKVKLSEVCTKITDGTHHSPEPQSEGFPYVTAKHVKKSGLDFYSKPSYVDEESHKEIYKRCTPEYGDILYIKDGATTGIACINTFREPISMLSSLALLKLKKGNIGNYYLCYWLNHSGIKAKLISEFMSGAAIQRYTLKKINSFSLTIPPINLQNQFAERVQAIEQQNAQAQASLQKSEELFGSLLQRAFKGELSV
ncbi:MAG: restriction endonuclease subunit S [Cyclobacteriaceae bacterium]|nr:restriction endonuclease subunit S [Cyclobacteriaceae bacterium]